MVQTCAVRGCKSNSRRMDNIHFYQFPSEKSNNSLRKQWLENVRRQNADGSEWDPRYFHKVCGKHFKEGRPTTQNPVPELDMGHDTDDQVTLPPRRGRQNKMASTSDSESKGGEFDPIRIESNEESNSSSVSETTRGTSSNRGTPTNKSPSHDSAPRSSSRKRKKRVLPDGFSDEEVLEELQQETETFTIWRARTVNTSSKVESQEPVATAASSRMMRPRRSQTTTQADDPEPEPLVPPKKKRFIMVGDDGEEEEKDAFCWMCHKEGTDLGCELCPRGFHLKCLDINQACPSWVCPECEKVMRAECVDTRSPAMSLLTIDQLCVILRFTCSQMRIAGSEPFSQPVDSSIPLYSDFIANPINFATLEKNIRRRMYGSTEAFLADVKWMLHNSIVFNGSNNKLTGMARAIVRICGQEISDIEGCPDCYTNAWIKQDKNWFIKPCRIPHTLVWAKLKGYPFWPGKAIIEDSGQTDVRFFGAHDRAWVPTTNVFLLSREPPVEMKNRRVGLEEAMDELNLHIKKLRDKFGSFRYATANIPYDPNATYSLVTRTGELKPEIKKELGVPVKTTMKKEISASASKDGVATHSDESNNSGGSDHDETTSREDVKKKVGVEQAPAAKTTPVSKKRTSERISAATSAGAPSPKLNSVDLNSVQQSESRGVFEVSNEALSLDATKIKRMKVSDERIVRSSPRSVNKKSIVEHLQQKMKEAEMESSDEKEKSAEEKTEEKVEEKAEEKMDCESVKSAASVNASMSPESASSSHHTRESTRHVANLNEKDINSSTSSTIDAIPQSSPKSETQMETVEDAAMEKMVTVETLSASGTPKKNPLLANLVESCKAKLGITGEDELKPAGDAESSPSVEMAEEDRSSSSSPQTNTSSKADDDDDDEDDEDDDDDDDEDYEQDAEEHEAEEETMAIRTRNEDHEITEKESADVSKKQDTIEGDVPKADVKSSTESGEKTEKGLMQDMTKTVDKPNEVHELLIKQVVMVETNSDKPATSGSATSEKGSVTRNNEEPKVKNIYDQCATVAIHAEAAKEDKANKVQHSAIVKALNSKVEQINTKDQGRIVKQELLDGVNNTTDDGNKAIGTQVANNESQVPKQDLINDNSKAVSSRLLEELVKPSVAGGNLEDGTQGSTVEPSAPEAVADKLAPQLLHKPSEETAAQVEGPATVSCIEKPPKIELETPAGNVETATDVGQPAAGCSKVHKMEVDEEQPPEKFTPMSVASRKLKTLQAMLRKDQSSTDGDTDFNVAKYVNKAMDGVQSVFQEMFDDFISSDMGHKASKHLKSELSRTKWHYEQAMLEQQHNASLVLAEVRMVLEHEQNVRIKKLIKLHEEELDRVVEETKSKQWCVNCSREAMFYCCWNTSYCDYPCQQKHWAKHMAHCTQSSQPTAPTVLHNVGDNTQTTPIHHGMPGNITEQVSRAEGKGAKRSHSEMTTPQPMTINTPPGIQYLNSQESSTCSHQKASKAAKISGSDSGMVHYITSPIKTTSASTVAQLLTNQSANTSSSSTPIMYQIV